MYFSLSPVAHLSNASGLLARSCCEDDPVYSAYYRYVYVACRLRIGRSGHSSSWSFGRLGDRMWLPLCVVSCSNQQCESTLMSHMPFLDELLIVHKFRIPAPIVLESPLTALSFARVIRNK
jgi:hypothetical protein